MQPPGHIYLSSHISHLTLRTNLANKFKFVTFIIKNTGGNSRVARDRAGAGVRVDTSGLEGGAHQLLQASQAGKGRARPSQDRRGEEGVGGGEGGAAVLLLPLVVVLVNVQLTLALLALLLQVAGRVITRIKFITTDIFSIMIYVIT